MLEDGSRGLVVKSGHGFYTVELDHNAGRILKRVAELRLEREALGLPSGELHIALCCAVLSCWWRRFWLCWFQTYTTDTGGYLVSWAIPVLSLACPRPIRFSATQSFADGHVLSCMFAGGESESGSGDEGGDEAEDGHPLSPNGRHAAHAAGVSPRGLVLGLHISAPSAGPGEAATPRSRRPLFHPIFL